MQEDSKNIVILPCPFCGSSASACCVGEPCKITGEPTVWRVECNSCNGMIDDQWISKESAIEAWNQRALL
jgi:Lar family restriction alleviation protein